MSIGRISTAMIFNNMADTTAQTESSLYQIQQQLSSGKKINSPSDDPLAAAQVTVLKAQLNQNGVFSAAIGSATTSIQTGAAAVGNALSQLQNAFQLSVQAVNGAYGPGDLKNIGSNLKGIVTDLVQTANSQDGSGNFIFSGAQTQTQPFQWTGSQYVYQGDQTINFIQTSGSTMTQANWSGDRLFNGALTGDGVVDAQAQSSNTGTAVVSKINQTSPGSYSGGPYQVSFSTNTSGVLQSTVTDMSSSSVISGPNNYTDQPITVAGASLSLSGKPQAGDTFTVDRAKKFNVLNALNDLANALSNPTTLTKSQLQNTMANSQRLLGNALNNLTTESAMMGAELNSLNLQKTAQENQGLALETARSNLEDVDYAKAITDFTAQKTALTASLQSFATIANLSLFNYLR